MSETTTTAAPYDAHQCPLCEVWVFTGHGPWLEDDPTKTALPILDHWFSHPENIRPTTGAVSYPFFSFNDVEVTAVITS